MRGNGRKRGGARGGGSGRSGLGRGDVEAGKVRREGPSPGGADKRTAFGKVAFPTVAALHGGEPTPWKQNDSQFFLARVNRLVAR